MSKSNTCDYCGAKIDLQIGWPSKVEHFWKHHPEIRFEVITRRLPFQNNRTGYTYQCGGCEKKFSSIGKVIKHFQERHQDVLNDTNNTLATPDICSDYSVSPFSIFWPWRKK